MPISKKTTGKKSTRKISSRIKRSTSSARRKSAAVSKRVIFVFLGGATILLFAALYLQIFSVNKFCANSISCIKDLSGKFDPSETAGVFHGKTVIIPRQEAIAMVAPSKNVLGESTGSKKIAVDLSSQHLYAYEGDQVVMDFPVSTGKWHYTPTGDYHIWVKLRYTKMEGGSGADYYNLPNVPYVMFFAGGDVSRGDGYSIHGAYWHNNFGHPMSHGCVNMKIADAGQLFAWADPQTVGWASPATDNNPGTEVVIYGTTPQE